MPLFLGSVLRYIYLMMTSAKHGCTTSRDAVPRCSSNTTSNGLSRPSTNAAWDTDRCKKQLESEFFHVKYGYRLAAQKLVTKLCLNCNPKALAANSEKLRNSHCFVWAKTLQFSNYCHFQNFQPISMIFWIHVKKILKIFSAEFDSFHVWWNKIIRF